MMAEADLIQFLSSGADAAMIFFAVILWKIDRRLLTVELQMKSMWKQFSRLPCSDGKKPKECD